MEHATVIVLAAGDTTPWHDYLGLPRHFAPVDGEPILFRTLRLLKPFEAQLHVVGPDERYRRGGASLFLPRPDASSFEADRFLSSRSLWSETGRTVVFFGDVYYTEAAIARIMAPREDWTYYCRHGASRFSGGDGPEGFALGFWPRHLEHHLAALERIVRLRRDGALWRCGAWELYRAMAGLPDAALIGDARTPELSVEIDDWTEDFDFPSDYDAFMARWRAR